VGLGFDGREVMKAKKRRVEKLNKLGKKSLVKIKIECQSEIAR